MGHRLVAACVAASLALLCDNARGERYVVDRVVAVVGDEPLLLSTLQRRADPHVLALHRTVTATGERLIGRAKIYRDVLERLIEERLMARAADQRGVAVAPEEIERALDQVAAQNEMSRAQLLGEVERSAGMTAAEYRDELRRQLLEYKLLQQELQYRDVFVGEEELRARHARLSREEPDTTPPFEQARGALTERLQTERLRALRDRWMDRLRREAYVEVRWSP